MEFCFSFCCLHAKVICGVPTNTDVIRTDPFLVQHNTLISQAEIFPAQTRPLDLYLRPRFLASLDGPWRGQEFFAYISVVREIAATSQLKAMARKEICTHESGQVFPSDASTHLSLYFCFIVRMTCKRSLGRRGYSREFHFENILVLRQLLLRARISSMVPRRRFRRTKLPFLVRV